MSYAPTQNWDLETIFSGGPAGEAFTANVRSIREELKALETPVASCGDLASASDAWSALILKLERIGDEIGTVRSFAHCYWSADAGSEEAKSAVSATADLSTRYASLHVHLKRAIVDADDPSFHAFVDRKELEPAAPMLRDIRRGAHLLMPSELQGLFVDLSREALHGWGQLYSLQSGKLRAELSVDGETRSLSIAELNGYRANPNEATRRDAFEAGQEAWEGIADVCAHTLTQITGARLTRNKRLGVQPLDHTLYANRLTQKTLDAILIASKDLQVPLQRYLDRKASLIGKQKLDWWDLGAPIGGGEMATLNWSQAQELVVSAFGGIYPRLQSFAQRALASSWVEAEARSGKRAGGYCTRVPQNRESRIFMSFTDSLNSCMTLAHELGHAYHNELLFDQPSSRMRITMALAETASTFAEALVLDQVLATADDDLKLFLIEQQLQRATTFAMNIPSRFAFERELFELREQGALRTDVLSDLSIRCQQTAYRGKLNSYDPMFWCSKLHFYISHFGFYNWPYTFGYLFSAAVYDRFKHQGLAFIPTLEELLLQTGYRWSEELAAELLDADIQDPDFWISATRPVREQLDLFLALTDKKFH